MELITEPTLSQYLPIELVDKIMTHKFYLERQYCLWNLHNELKDQLVRAVVTHEARYDLDIEIVEQDIGDYEYKHYLAILDERRVFFPKLCYAFDVDEYNGTCDDRRHADLVGKFDLLLEGAKSYADMDEEDYEEDWYLGGNESDDESDDGYRIYIDGEEMAWFPKKEDLREFFDDCVDSIKEHGVCLPSYHKNHKPINIWCTGDDEVEDWMWHR